jgi:hypothetical protein
VAAVVVEEVGVVVVVSFFRTFLSDNSISMRFLACQVAWQAIFNFVEIFKAAFVEKLLLLTSKVL